MNASMKLAKAVADGLGMELPEAMPRAIDPVPAAEVSISPELSLMARRGDGSVRTRRVAILVADGVALESVTTVQEALLAAGAVGRLIAPRIGPFATAEGGTLDADASLENEAPSLFDALVLPDGAAAVALLAADGRTMEFLRDQHRHLKTIVAIGASSALLEEAKIRPGHGVDLAVSGREGSKALIAGLKRHPHFEREEDPPRV